MDNSESYYDILEVLQSATPDEIKKSFYKLAHEYHPDRNTGATEKVKSLGEQKFKEITEAYDVLKDVDMRKQYDAKLKAFKERKQAFQTSHTSHNTQSQKAKTPTPPKSNKKMTRRYIFWIIFTSLILVTIIATANSSDSTSSMSLVPNNSVTTLTPAPSLGGLPTQVGQCDSTTVSKIGTRLTDGSTGQDIVGSGSAINYADGGYQVSYDTISGIQGSTIGDQVNLCLVSIPTDCPAGDNRGRVYQATNLRTRATWTAPDAEHSCGGA